MKPSARRRVEREFAALIERDGDHCSLCHQPLKHNSKIYGGITKAGETALTSDCCASKLKETVVSGVYMDGPIVSLPLSKSPSGSRVLPPSDADEAVSRLQDYVAEVDRLSADIATRAGISQQKTIMNFEDSPWKDDDRAWFEANPERSHRLRKLYAGEDVTLVPPGQSVTTPPPFHENQVLIRQVQPGQRVKKLFCRNLATPIPEVEDVFHAIFDIVTGRREGVITTKEVADLASRYASPAANSERKPN